MDYEEAASFLMKKFKKTPSIFIVYSTALGNFPKILENSVKISCDEVPRFPPKKEGNISPQFVFGKLFHQYILVLQGRYHYYEDYSKEEMSIPVKIAGLLGCTNMFITNAVGSMNRNFELGDLMIIKNHLNVIESFGDNPLKVFNENRRKFRNNTGVYDENFMVIARKMSVEEGMDKYVKSGIYAMVNKTSLNSSSDIITLKTSGADVVGTSIVPEVLTAADLKMSVFGLSVVTDKGILDYGDHPDPMPEEIIRSVQPKRGFVNKLILKYVEYCSDIRNTEIL